MKDQFTLILYKLTTLGLIASYYSFERPDFHSRDSNLGLWTGRLGFNHNARVLLTYFLIVLSDNNIFEIISDESVVD